MSATVKYAGGGGGKAQGYIFPASDSVSISGAAGTTTTVNLTVIGDGALSVSSSDSTKATGSISGNILTITAVANGSATITITMADSSSYLGTTATISVECNLVTVGSTYKLGSGAHTSGTADLECVVLDIIGTNAVCQSKGIYGGTWPDINELTSIKSTYFGNLANAVSGIYLPRGNADGSATSTTPTKVFVYNGTSFVNTYSTNAKNALTNAAYNYTTYNADENRASLGTPYESTGIWSVHSNGTFSTRLKTQNCVIAPSFILDLTKVKLHGSLIVDKDAPNPPAIVSFSAATPAQREAIVRAYEAGTIDITEYWSDGEEATVTLPAIAAVSPLTDTYNSQSVTYVLSLDNSLSLNQPLANGNGKSKFVILMKNVLTPASGTSGINTTNTNAGGWPSSARRNWCRTAYKTAFEAAIGSICHDFILNTSEGQNKVASAESICLATCKMITNENHKSATYMPVADDSVQLNYYKTASHKIKYNQGTAIRYWTSSASGSGDTGYTYCYEVINADGTHSDTYASYNYYLSPIAVI